MIIAVSAQGNSLQAEVDPRFGRCKYFIIVNTETLDEQIIENTAVNADTGAGIQSAQLVVDKGVKVVLTGRVGPKAERVLEAGAVEIVEGVNGQVSVAIDKYLAG